MMTVPSSETAAVPGISATTNTFSISVSMFMSTAIPVIPSTG